MLNRLASLSMSTSVLKALPGKLDIKRHSPIILYISDPSLSGYRYLTHRGHSKDTDQAMQIASLILTLGTCFVMKQLNCS